MYVDKILVLGFYDRDNLGDEMYKITFSEYFNQFDVKLLCVDDISTVLNENDDINKYKAIICGGGDIMNSYFMDNLLPLRNIYRGNIIAFSVGIPYRNTEKKWLDMLDHIFLRNITDLSVIQMKMGSIYAHYMPDFAFRLYKPLNLDIFKEKNKKERKTIGFFLARPGCKNLKVVYSYARLIEDLSKTYNIILIPFNTSAEDFESDYITNQSIIDMIGNDNVSTINISQTYEMLDYIEQNLDFAVCQRLHSNIFCTIKAIPYLAIVNTRKVQLYNDENNYTNTFNLDINESFDKELFIEKFNKVVNNSEQIRNQLEYISKTNYTLLSNNKVINLIKNSNTRPKINDNIIDLDIETLTKESHMIYKEISGHDPEDDHILNKSDATHISEIICYRVTNTPGSKYVFGTVDNLIKDHKNLKGMIDWMVKDHQQNYLKERNAINIDYICQSSFKGVHRAGWEYVIRHIRAYSTWNGIICDTYIDRTFHWGKRALINDGILPYTAYWIGFIHHTSLESYTDNNLVNLLNDSYFRKSLIVCKGIICLTDYLANWIRTKFEENSIKVNVFSLKHPTLLVDVKFDINKFKNTMNIVNVGAWYRNPFTIHTINVKNFNKCSLHGPNMNNYFRPKSFVLSYHGYGFYVNI